jgi:hypothetical protein
MKVGKVNGMSRQTKKDTAPARVRDSKVKTTTPKVSMATKSGGTKRK